jgi:hypothetical protein
VDIQNERTQESKLNCTETQIVLPHNGGWAKVCKANHNKEETVVAQCTHNHWRAQGTIYTHDIASSAVGGVKVADTSLTPKVAAKKY